MILILTFPVIVLYLFLDPREERKNGDFSTTNRIFVLWLAVFFLFCLLLLRFYIDALPYVPSMPPSTTTLVHALGLNFMTFFPCIPLTIAMELVYLSDRKISSEGIVSSSR